MRVLVTGVAGFIGSHVAAELTQLGDEVYGIDDLSGGSRENVPAGVEFEQLDCGSDLENLFKEFCPEAVIHLAAYAAEGLSHHIPSFNYENNLLATTRILNTSYKNGVQHFVFTSSIAAYGHPPTDRAFTEATPCNPCDPYGIAKLACERQIACYQTYYGGPKYTIFRPHNVFGPNQNISDPYRNVVGIFLRCVMQNSPLPVFGNGTQTRDFSYIDVVAKSIAASLRIERAENEVFNIGGDESHSVLDLANRILEISQSDSKVEFLPARKEVQHAHADHSKARNVFAEQFETAKTFDEGLLETWQHASKLPIPQETRCPSEVENWEQLPPSWVQSLKQGEG
ncbi:MAG: NAD-dependent epimerase/dehydratase family protein [Planctomycetota bacterium]